MSTTYIHHNYPQGGGIGKEIKASVRSHTTARVLTIETNDGDVCIFVNDFIELRSIADTILSAIPDYNRGWTDVD